MAHAMRQTSRGRRARRLSAEPEPSLPSSSARRAWARLAWVDLGQASSSARPGGALFGAATQATERKRATDHGLFAQRATARARQIAVELDQSTATVTQSVEQQSPERDPRDKLFTRAREALLQSAVEPHRFLHLPVATRLIGAAERLGGARHLDRARAWAGSSALGGAALTAVGSAGLGSSAAGARRCDRRG